MDLTSFHSKQIWQDYASLRPRDKTAYETTIATLVDIYKNNNQESEKVRVLVLGSGDGSYDVGILIQALTNTGQLSNFEITVVDWSGHENIKNIKTVEFILQDIEIYLQTCKESFSIVISFLVLHHLINWRKAIENISRIASGGHLMFDEYLQNKSGWIDWVDRGIGSRGLKVNLNNDAILSQWEAFFEHYYNYLDLKHGVIWSPEISGTNYNKLHKVLQNIGFKNFITTNGKASGQLSVFIKSLQSLINNKNEFSYFSHFKWATKTGDDLFLLQFIEYVKEQKLYSDVISQLDGNSDIEIEIEMTFEHQLNIYTIPNFEDNHLRPSKTFWMDHSNDSKFQTTFMVDNKELMNEDNNYEMLQRNKLIQHFIFSGCFTSDLTFCSPLFMTVKDLSKWETETAKKNVILVNNKKTQNLNILKKHLKNMANFSVNETSSLTESFLKLKLPLSILLREQTKEESNVSALATIHNNHIGDLIELALPPESRYQQIENNDVYEADDEWLFSSFRTISINKIQSQTSVNALNISKKNLTIEWKGNVQLQKNVVEKIHNWLSQVLPYLGIVVTANSRIVILGIYQSRLNNDEYGGIGSIFLVEEVSGKVTEFDLERFKFMQSNGQHFSAIYMAETLRKITASETKLSESLKTYQKIEEPLAVLRGLRSEIDNIRHAIDEIEDVLEPNRLQLAHLEYMDFRQGLTSLFIDPHNVKGMGSEHYIKLFEHWRKHKDQLEIKLSQSSVDFYYKYFVDFDLLLEKVVSEKGEEIVPVAAYLAKSIMHGKNGRSPLTWIYKSLNINIEQQDMADLIKYEVSLNEIPPLMFNMSLHCLKNNSVLINHQLNRKDYQLVITVLVKEDESEGKLDDLIAKVSSKVKLDYISLANGQTSTALAVLIKANTNDKIDGITSLRSTINHNNEIELTLVYALGIIR